MSHGSLMGSEFRRKARADQNCQPTFEAYARTPNDQKIRSHAGKIKPVRTCALFGSSVDSLVKPESSLLSGVPVPALRGMKGSTPAFRVVGMAGSNRRSIVVLQKSAIKHFAKASRQSHVLPAAGKRVTVREISQTMNNANPPCQHARVIEISHLSASPFSNVTQFIGLYYLFPAPARCV